MNIINLIISNNNSDSEIRRIFRFLLIGGLAAVVDLLVAFALIYGIGNELYSYFICSAFKQCYPLDFLYGKFEECVSIVSFFSGFLVSYYGHAKYTFRTRTSKDSFLKLFGIAIINIIIRTFIINIEKNFNITGYICVVNAIFIVTVISYLASKFWVFKPR